ncbi:MAG TPA: lipid-binding SYLF domain-containing protein [Vicinamibacteria bacterium]
MSQKTMALVGACLLAASPVLAETKEDKRLLACREVLQEFLGMKEATIPRSLIDRAKCLAVVPSVKKFALGFGGRWGKGAVACRTEGGKGPWGPPLMMSLGGGSFGIQIGGQAADVVLLIMNAKGIDYLLKSEFTLGADASVAAGPVGRTGEASTDLRMQAEILSYSRTRGLFAGVALEGAVVKQDKDGNRSVYDEDVSPRELLFLWSHPIPQAAQGLVDLLNTISPRPAE